jgi:anti-sigma factor RsiW
MTCVAATSLMPLYLTGELDEARARDFAKHTQSCPECAHELSRQIAVDARLRAAVLAEPADTSAIEARVTLSIAGRTQTVSRAPAWRWTLTAAAAAALLMTGYGGYRALLPPKVSPAFAAAALDHHTEIVEGQPRRWRTDIASVSDLAAREGISISLISRIAPADYHFQQARLCRLDGVIYLHLVYSDSTGARNFSMFLNGQNQDHIAKLYASSLGAEHVAGFEDGHVRAMVVTDQSGDAALQFARFAASVI